MVAQSNLLKTSSKLARLWNLAQRARGAQATRLARKLLKAYARERQQSLLGELANLDDRGCKRFWRLWGHRFKREADASLLALRNDLREVWKPGTRVARKQQIIEHWLEWRPRGFAKLAYSPWLVLWGVPRPIPAPRYLRPALVWAALERSDWLARCHNPDCPAPYFLARRKDQKYCERGDCTAYAQRQYALKWWKEKGEALRAARKRKARPKRRKAPRGRR